MLRVGRIPYLNCEPFFSHLRGVDLVPLNPRALGQAMAAGPLDAGPLSELGGAVIGVTEETSTSVQILKLLLSLKYEVIPRHWVGPDNPCDAVLLIGDRAIRALKLGPPFPHVTDLGSEWVRWTGLPCVFARWGGLASVPETERLALEGALSEALDRGLAGLAAIAARRRDTGFAEDEGVAYLRGFTYHLGAEEEKAIAEFSRLRELLENERC